MTEKKYAVTARNTGPDKFELEAAGLAEDGTPGEQKITIKTNARGMLSILSAIAECMTDAIEAGGQSAGFSREFAPNKDD